jgi:hypothetical protein
VTFVFEDLPQRLYTMAIPWQSLLRLGPAFYPFYSLLFSVAAIPGSLFAMTLAQGMLVRTAITQARGDREGLGTRLLAGLRHILPLISLCLVLMLAISLGYALLLVPGMILGVVWSVAAPALVAEKLSVTEALVRSAQLTRGARWRIFFLLLVVQVTMRILFSIISIVLTLNGVVMSSGLFSTITTIVGVLFGAISLSLTTSLYVGLRDWKEGPEDEVLAEVFA